MDSLTHALTAALLAYALHLPQLLPFFVLGAVIVDADILYGQVSDRLPSLYLFVHGGIAHSIAGSIALSVIAWSAAASVLAAGIVQPAGVPATWLTFAAVLSGAFLHIGLDSLAVPGLPLLVPFSDRKYTAGLLPGPSILLMAASLFFFLWLGLRVTDLPSLIVPYLTIIAAFLAVRFAAFCTARIALLGKGRGVPTINPLRWLVIGETPEAWTVAEYRIGKGTGETERIVKYRLTDPGEIASLDTLMEVRRLRFHSYIATAERIGDEIIFSDPLRESGRIFYPPHYRRVRIRLPVPAGPPVIPEVP